MDDLERRISAHFSAHGLMALLRAGLVHVSPGEVHIALSPRPELCQQDGHIQAGALASILDGACSYAAMTVAQPGLDVLTIEFKLKFIRPAAPADRFIAVGKVTKKVGTTLTMCDGEIHAERDSQREPLAVMQATISNVPADD